MDDESGNGEGDVSPAVADIHQNVYLWFCLRFMLCVPLFDKIFTHHDITVEHWN